MRRGAKSAWNALQCTSGRCKFLAMREVIQGHLGSWGNPARGR